MRNTLYFLCMLFCTYVLFTGIVFAEGTISTFPGIGNIQGLAVDGNYIWCNCDVPPDKRDEIGVVRLDKRDGSYIRFTEPIEMTYSIQMRGPIAVDKNGNVWVSRNTFLMKYDGENWSLHHSELFSQRFWFDSTGLLWIAHLDVTQLAEGALSNYDGTTLKKYKNTKVTGITVAIDSNDIKWVAYFKEGIASFDDETWTQYTTEDGLVDDYVWDIYIDHNDVKWIGTANGISRFDGESWQSWTKEDLQITSTVVEIWGDSNDVIWFGTWDDGLLKYDGSEWKQFTIEDGLLDNRIFAVSVDNNNMVWIGSENGLSCYCDSTYSTSVDEEDDMPEALPVLHSYPNPFNPSTTIEFILPESGFATLSIYNISGQKVRELAAGYMTAGMHNLTWNGRDGSGDAVSSGIYITRLVAGKQVAAGRMILLK